MMDMLREMIHALEVRVAALEARLPLPPEDEPANADGGEPGPIQPDDPTNEDEAA